MRVKIEVTASDIKRGVVKDCKDCPVARAIRRKLERSAVCLSVGADSFDFFHKGCFYGYCLPEEASRFIGAFDSRTAVKPFSFCLNLPREVLKEAK